MLRRACPRSLAASRRHPPYASPRAPKALEPNHLSVASPMMMMMLPRSVAVSAATTKGALCKVSRIYRGQEVRFFSDRLMGYSPMSPGGVAPILPPGSPNSRIPTVEDVTTAGGVWAPTSSKRDKLAELKLELDTVHNDLDGVASPLQLQDLYLSDGMQLVAKITDQALDFKSADSAEVANKENQYAQDSMLKSNSSGADHIEGTKLQEKILPKMKEFLNWLDQNKRTNDALDQMQYAAYLAQVSEKISFLRDSIPANQCLKEIRDFMDPSKIDVGDELPDSVTQALPGQQNLFEDAVTLFRLYLLSAVLDHLREESSWKTLTKVSDSDVDRAAVRGASIEALRQSRQIVSTVKLHAVLRAFAVGSSHERVDQLWRLFDHDEDGLLDQPEMNDVVRFAVKPVQQALNTYFDAVLDANVHSILDDKREIGEPVPTPSGFRARRREKQAKKHLRRMFQRTTRVHFEDEVEMAHRLRCIYAWSEKNHQNNQLDSVLVEAEDASWAGRKRYVELPPKISLAEFREVQKMHFTHLDRVAVEIMSSFRENLWVDQGKGRQNRELIRDCLLFLIGVSIIDYAILAL